jgi:hypothetical protein
MNKLQWLVIEVEEEYARLLMCFLDRSFLSICFSCMIRYMYFRRKERLSGKIFKIWIAVKKALLFIFLDRTLLEV